MRQAVLFDTFAYKCPYSNPEVNDGYGCNHPSQDITLKENGKNVGCCSCFGCPLGTEAEQEDFGDKEINWDGCENEDITEGEYLLVNSGEDASQDVKDALALYNCYMHRYESSGKENPLNQ